MICLTAALVQDLMAGSALRRPEAPFVIHGNEITSYGEIEAGSNRIARLLSAIGIVRGDRVGLLVPNSARYVRSFYGALKAGAIAVPLHASTDARSLRHLLADCEARAVICGPGVADRIALASEELPDLGHVVVPEAETGAEFPAHVHPVAESDAGRFSPEAPEERGIDLDPACIIYTSGSTGRPRGALLSHMNLVSNTRSILSFLELTAEDRGLCLLPFPYVYGNSLLNTHAAVGGALVLHDGMAFPETVLDTIERDSVTGLAGVSSTYAILLHRSTLGRRPLPSLRYLTQSGSVMPVPHVRRLIEALPGVRIFLMYGATEGSARLTVLPPEDLPRKIGSIGKPVRNVEITIRREDGTEVAPGEIGEIVVRGSNVMQGYWRDSASTAEVLGPRGLYTGDLARRDAEGYIWLEGRKREMIKSGAHRISPREIVEVLLEHPLVEEAAVLGEPDEILGEKIVAHVTVRTELTVTAEGIVRFCRDRLPAHKVPHKVCLRDSMPRGPSGKIDNAALRSASGARQPGIS